MTHAFLNHLQRAPLLLALALCAPVVLLSGCGGDPGTDESTAARIKRLVGKVYAKVIGDKIGQIQGNVKELTSTLNEIEGTFEVDGAAYPFKATLSVDGIFEATVPMPINGPNSTMGRAVIFGTVIPNAATDAEPVSIRGSYLVQAPSTSGSSSYVNVYDGDVQQGSSNTSGSGGGTQLPPGSCDWNASAFYNPQQVVSYQGQYYTARGPVVPFGTAGAPLFNPAVNATSWSPGGQCGPTPFVTVETATCARGTNADVITLTGKAYGGGLGDAIAAYTNVTDRAFSNENAFGLPGTSYSMTCTGGGFVGSFSSTSTPVYKLCVKTVASAEATAWTSTQTVPRSSTSIGFTTAYASKGNPLLGTTFAIGAVVLGFDAVRSEGKAISGNCQ